MSISCPVTSNFLDEHIRHPSQQQEFPRSLPGVGQPATNRSTGQRHRHERERFKHGQLPVQQQSVSVYPPTSYLPPGTHRLVLTGHISKPSRSLFYFSGPFSDLFTFSLHFLPFRSTFYLFLALFCFFVALFAFS
jgi:hypothetical protein